MGDRVLLGAVPTEQMDVVFDPRGMRVVPNPESPNVPRSRARAASCASERGYDSTTSRSVSAIPLRTTA